MVDIKKIKIKRTTYSFDINRLYTHEKKFDVVNKNPVQILFEGFRKSKKKKSTLKAKQKQEQKKGINPLLIGGLIGLLMIILIGGWIYVSINNIGDVVVEPEIIYTMNMNIFDGSVITYGTVLQGLHTGKVTLSQKIEGYEDINLTLITYLEEPPYQVYILEEPRDKSQTTTYYDFKTQIFKILKQRGITLNIIDSSQLKTITQGALVIVPSARIPEIMIEPGESNIKNLLKRGVQILYIGKEFTDNVDPEGQVQITNQTNLRALGIEFENTNIGNSELEYLYQPQYIAVSEIASYLSWTEYGVVSIIKDTNGLGYLITVPQTLDAGWSNGENAALDISKMVLEMKWMQPNSEKIYSIESSNETIKKTYFTESFPEENVYVKIELSGLKDEELYGKIGYIEINKETNGELYITDGTALLSTSISGKEIRIKADLKEPTSGSIYPYITIIENGQEIKKESLSNLKINTQTESDFDVSMDIQGGEYSTQIVDEQGEVYAEGYVNSVPIEISLKRPIDDNVFVFTFSVENQKKELKEIKVSVDDGKLGEYTFTSSSQISIDLKPMLGLGELPEGEHVFKFTIGELEEEYTYGFTPSETIFTSPLFLGTIVFAVGIIFVGGYLAGQRKPEYFIDVPDFPPAEFTKVPVKKQVILDVFKKENEYHRWKNQPLTLLEIKNGLGKTYYKGKNLNTSDFNLGYILDQLKKRELIVEEFGYYMPKKWAEERGARFLAMFRKLRDICVINAVPFTKRGFAKTCDSILRVIGQEMYVHVYDKGRENEIVSNLVKNIKKGINIVLVKNEYERNHFKEFLTSPTKAAAIVKFENEGKTVSVMTLENFEKMIKEMKS